MNTRTIKKLAFLLSFSTLIWNVTPIFAQTLEIEVLAGGYKLRGPSTINFASVSASKNTNQSILNFADLNGTNSTENTNNYLEIIDENGGKPFNVTVSATSFVRNESLPIDCNLNPKKCIPLSNFSFANNDGYTATTIINGNSEDFTTNAQTNSLKAFSGRTTTIAGSTGSTLKVADSSVFDVGENITIGNATSPTPDAIPSSATILSIDDDNTITTSIPFSTTPAEGIIVTSTSSRSLSLADGTGAAPSDIKIYPQIQINIPAGQMPGVYETTLSFTII